MIKKFAIAVALLVISGCHSVPEGVTPVAGFDKDRYLGKWYEIARLDHSFERGMNKVTAEYSLQEDGGIKVVNRGFKADEQAWSEAAGRAYFVDSSSVGHLEVSFFGPFFSSYVVFELGEDYEYAFVSGYNTNYLWLLSRTPIVSDALLARFLRLAEEKGFDAEEVILSVQN
ncbi:lipocalin family protein [Enterovibrio norvegicus]|uniref:lipocalin family protein n=1 Tax=Enterovibrio norvegicus TaxID=188144 RepID=UPI000C84FEBE|nr:lipocalin family protein [Enterovibrio norvegicus]PMN71921.1 lipocalin [Enterovibrio norvegicus]